MRSRTLFTIAAITMMVCSNSGTAQTATQQKTIQKFFDEFTADWVRSNPNQAISTRYFTGAEQDRLEQQLTPETLEWRRGRVRLARRGLADLGKFDRSRMTPIEQIS